MEFDSKDLLAVGSRVECGIRWKGVLMNYFTGPNEYDGKTSLYGVIRLDEHFRERNSDGTSGAFINMLVVNSGNLHPEGHYEQWA